MPRRILYLTPSVRMLGARQSLLQLVRALDPARYEPVVVAPERGGLAEALEAEGVAVEYVRMRPWRKGRSWPFIPFTVGALRRIVRARDVALVHGNEIYPTPYALAAAGACPVVSHVRLETTPVMARKYRLGRAHRVVCVSDAVRRSLLGRGGPSFGKESLCVVHNGLDADRFVGGIDAPAERASLRRSLNIAEDAVVFAQYGLLSARKRHVDVLKALARWAGAEPVRSGHSVYLVIGDEGPRDPGFAERLHAEARGFGFDVFVEDRSSIAERPYSGDAHTGRPRVMFLRFRPRIAPYFAAADCLVLPSEQEGFGRVILEAAAFEVPAIGSRVGGIPEIIADGETGWLFDVGKADALAGLMDQAARGTIERLRMGRKARRRMLEAFSIAGHAMQVQEIYDGLLG